MKLIPMLGALLLGSLLGCAGGGGSSTPAKTPALVKWAQPSYTMGTGSTFTGLATVNVTAGSDPLPGTLGINIVDLDTAIPGGPTHTNSSVFTGSNGVVNVPFYTGTVKGTWRFRADLVIGTTTSSDTVTFIVQ